MMIILQEGGLGSGGMNFDAKTRRNSTDLEDIFIGHINSMDTLARGLLIADNILNNSDYLELRKNRYLSFDYDQGAKFSKGEIDLEQLSNLAATKSEPDLISGKQELFESLINKYI